MHIYTYQSSRALREARINEGAITPKTPTRSSWRISLTTLILLIGNILALGLKPSEMHAGNLSIVQVSVALLGDASIVGAHNIK